MIPSQNF